jgi:type I restriction enzyme S subunit
MHQRLAMGSEARADDRPKVHFGDVVCNVDESVRDPQTYGLERFVGLEHIDPESLHIQRWGLTADGTSFTRRFHKGQVLFGKRRAYQRKVAIAEFDGLCSSDILVFEPTDARLLPELLPFICQTEGFFEHALDTSAGSLSPRTKFKELARYEFCLPPIDEQHRIAEILWAVENEIITLAKVLENTIALDASFSNVVFYGTEQPGIKLGNLIQTKELELQTGPFGTVLQASSYVNKGTPIVNPVNMIDGKFNTEDGPFLPPNEVNRLSQYKLVEGDIVIGRKGDVGRAVLVIKEYTGFILGSDCIRIRLRSRKILPRYIYYYLLSKVTRDWIARFASGTTMPGINEKIVSQMQIVIPKIRDQERDNLLFDQIDNAVQTIKVKLEKVHILRKELRDFFMKVN